jgi:hypothetical protein
MRLRTQCAGNLLQECRSLQSAPPSIGADLALFVSNRRQGGFLNPLFTMRELSRASMELELKCHDLTQFIAHFGRSPAPSHAACEARSPQKLHGAKMTQRNPNASTLDTGRTDLTLDRRYREIGISAVAAALQFQKCGVKNPAHAQASSPPDDERLPGIAA